MGDIHKPNTGLVRKVGEKVWGTVWRSSKTNENMETAL